MRYLLLRQAQRLVAPPLVQKQLALGGVAWLRPVLGTYRRLQHLQPSRWLRALLLPQAFKAQILALDVEPAAPLHLYAGGGHP